MTKRPNLLLIMPDQMRGDCISLEKHPVLQTPNIDAIGQGGMLFTRGYTTAASCIPARRSLLTGQFPATNGMVGYREGVPLQSPTVTQMLRDAGYFTAIAGRYMHQAPYDEPYGFETRVLGSTYITHDAYAHELDERNPGRGGIYGIGLSCNGRTSKAWPFDEALHPTNWTIQQSRKLIADADSARPMFLVSSFYAPHPPLFPPERHLNHFLDMDLPPAAISETDTPPSREMYENDVDAHHLILQGEELRRAQAGYFGLIQHLDEQLSELIAAFIDKSQKARRPWLILFTSDHGEMLGDHYRFRKCEPYEGASRIPFLIRGAPELGFVVGGQCKTPVCLEDIMPTLLELAGIQVPDNIDGQSLLSVLRGETDRVRAFLHCEHATCYDQDQSYHFLTDGRMKYIWRPAGGAEQLFDHQTDPRELNDLSRCPDWQEELTSWRNRLIDTLRDRPEGFSDGTQLVTGRPYDAVLPGRRCKCR